ncbi:hypothetical protein HELRODRAFT_189216 [Helobdella robusta]|uniref:Sodium-coupled monocarboxylate transporter 1 n=1 Tax=Helobdella robusta TaxID=6412 RepID=T1FQT1_HELRO|nr:hypothetical protein HELRODRAFT_189216 [Helobdella robusta]ESN96363.1 hypothetical protein HELRODRAFT_189216 [Helobdella robusta]
MSFHIVDYVIFALVLVVSLIIGLYHAFSGGKQKTPKEYLVGNRSMSTLPVALSMLVSFLSGIVVLGTPAEIYTKGTQLFMRTIGYTLACIISSLFIVPLFFNLKVTSSFEYLEARFKSKVTKLLGTVSFLLGNIFYMGLLLYTPSTAMVASTGLNLYISIVAIAIIGTGGLRGVVWVDAFQAVIMLGGMLFIVVQGILLVGGFKEMWSINEAGGRIIFFNFNPDPTQRLSFWSTIIGGCFSTLTVFGVGQISVQRYCSLPTLPKAQLSVMLNVPLIISMNVLTSLVGLVVFAYYANLGCDPVRSKQVQNVNQLVPYFMVNVLNYPGLPGAFLAVLFSGALSSISSSLNSCAAVTWQDLVSHFFKNKTEHRKALIIKVLVALYGLCALGIAFLAQLVGQHVLQASLSFSGATMGPSLGMFLLGGIFPFANAKGAISGCVVASIFSLWLSIGAFVTKPHMQTLPTSIDRCYEYNISTTTTMMTTSIMTDSVTTSNPFYEQATSPATHGEVGGGGGLEKMYEVSFLWYSAIGCLLTIIIGVVVSLIFSTYAEMSLLG